MVYKELEERISELIEEMGNYDVESEEYSHAVKNLDILLNQYNQMRKNASDAEIRQSQLSMETEAKELEFELKAQELKIKANDNNSKNDNEFNKLIMHIGEVLIMVGCTALMRSNDYAFKNFWLDKGFEFETTGAFSSQSLRKVSDLKPFKIGKLF